MTTSMNERTHFFIKIYLSHFILERVDVGRVWEVSWRRRQTATYWPKVLLAIAALLSHLGWVAQPWVTEGPKPSICRWLSIWHLVSNWLKPSVSWLYFCLTPTCFHCSSTYLHRCISWLMARLRVNMLQYSFQWIFHSLKHLWNIFVDIEWNYIVVFPLVFPMSSNFTLGMTLF